MHKIITLSVKLSLCPRNSCFRFLSLLFTLSFIIEFNCHNFNYPTFNFLCCIFRMNKNETLSVILICIRFHTDFLFYKILLILNCICQFFHLSFCLLNWSHLLCSKYQIYRFQLIWNTMIWKRWRNCCSTSTAYHIGCTLMFMQLENGNCSEWLLRYQIICFSSDRMAFRCYSTLFYVHQ